MGWNIHQCSMSQSANNSDNRGTFIFTAMMMSMSLIHMENISKAADSVM